MQHRSADAAFAAAGWVRDEPVLVLTTPVRPGTAPGVPVELRPSRDAAWLAAYAARGTALPPGAVEVLTGAEDDAFASVRLSDDEASPAGVARGVLVEAGWASPRSPSLRGTVGEGWPPPRRPP